MNTAVAQGGAQMTGKISRIFIFDSFSATDNVAGDKLFIIQVRQIP